MKSLSHVWLYATLWTVAYQAPLSMGFSKQEYWSGLPFPFPGDLSDPGIKPGSPALQADALLSEPQGNETEVDIFLEFSCFFYDWTDAVHVNSGSSAVSKSCLNISKFLVHILLNQSNLENFENYFASMWNECNCAVVWKLFDIALLWNWSENWPFPFLWPLLSFPNLLACGAQHLNSIIF